jgi:hypothetical protein
MMKALFQILSSPFAGIKVGKDDARPLLLQRIEAIDTQPLVTALDHASSLVQDLLATQDDTHILDVLLDGDMALADLLDRSIPTLVEPTHYDDQLHRQLETSRAISVTLVKAYDRICARMMADADFVADQNTREQAVGQLFYWLARNLTVEAAFDGTRRRIPWADIHSRYLFALQPLSKRRNGTADLTAIDSPVNRHLSYLVLQTLSVTADQSPRHVLVADSVARNLAGTVKLYSGLSPIARRAIDANAWRVIETGLPRSEAMRALYFGLDECLLKLHSFKHRMRSLGHVPEEFDRFALTTTEEARDLIDALRAQWSGRGDLSSRPVLYGPDGTGALIFRQMHSVAQPLAAAEHVRGPITQNVLHRSLASRTL